MSAEKWRDVVGWEGLYWVSDLGRACSVHARRPFLIGTTSPDGYRLLRLRDAKNGRKDTVGLHRLVLEAFVGPCPPGFQACHNDGNAANNALSNLRWDSTLANAADRKKHGTQSRARSTLTAEQVTMIRANPSVHDSEWAEKFGVKRGVISNARTGVTWRDTCGTPFVRPRPYH